MHVLIQELIENSVKPKQNKMSGTDHDALSQLLVEKDRELKQTMAVSKFIAPSKLCIKIPRPKKPVFLKVYAKLLELGKYLQRQYLGNFPVQGVGTLNIILLFQLASRQGEVEKNIQALNVQVKKLDDAIKELQKKFKDAETVLATAIFQVGIMLFSILHYGSNLNLLLHMFTWALHLEIRSVMCIGVEEN